MDWEQNQKPPHEGSKLHPQHQHLASPNPIGQDCLSQIKTPVTKSTDQGRRTAHVPSERNVQTHGSLAPLSCNVRLEEPLDRPLGTFGAVVQKKNVRPKNERGHRARDVYASQNPVWRFCALLSTREQRDDLAINRSIRLSNHKRRTKQGTAKLRTRTRSVDSGPMDTRPLCCSGPCTRLPQMDTRLTI